LNNKKQVKLSYKLILGMILITAIGLLVALSFINTMVRDIAYSNALESAMLDRMNKAHQIDAWFEEAVQIIANLSETLPLVDRSHYQDIVVHYLQRHEFIQAIWVTMEDGGFYDSGFWEPPYWFVPQERDWWALAAERSGEVITTPPYTSASTGEIWTALSSHNRNWQGQEATITMAIELEQLEVIINDFEARTEGYLMLTTPEGGFVIHPNPDYIPREDGLASVLRNMSEIPHYAEIFARFDSGEYFIEYVDPHGIPSYFALFTLPSTDWTLISVIPTAITGVPVRQVLSVVIFATIFVLAMAMIFAFIFLSRRFVKPIEVLTASINEITLENLNANIIHSASRNDEIGLLSQTIIKMLREIEEKTFAVVDLKKAIISTMAELVEHRDEITGGHITRTQRYIKVLIAAMKENGVYLSEVSEFDEELVLLSCQLHDVGKIVVKDAILNKPGKLTAEEFEAMKIHTTFGEKVIFALKEKTTDSDFLEYARIFAVTHHEKWDGSGYPYGLSGEEIPLLGRMMAIGDVYDALVKPRPYKDVFTHEKAVNIILEGRGTHFDPLLTDLFEKIHHEFEKISAEAK